MLAERDDARDTGGLRPPLEMRELRIVAIEHGRAAGLEAEEDFGLGVGDLGQRAEEFQMHRLDGGDDGDMRAREPRQRLDLAGMVHAHFEHRIARARRAARQRQRHAPMIVVGRDRGMRLAVLRQRQPQRLLGAGLADRAGDADHLGVGARARRGREIAQRREHVGHDKQRRIVRHVRTPVGGDNGEAGLGRKRRGDEIVAVAVSPWMAKNASPRPMVRLSMESPDTPAGSAPCRSARIAAAIASTVQSAAALMRPSP